MMKQVLFFVFLSVFTSFSQEVKLEIRDGLYSTSLENAIIVIENIQKQTIDSIYLGNSTEYTFQMNLKKKKSDSYKISVCHPSESYYSRTVYLRWPKAKTIIYLYPTKAFEEEFVLNETKKYSNLTEEKDTSYLDSVQNQEQFSKLISFLTKNFVFPDEDNVDYLNHRAVVRFKVELDGQITSIKIMRIFENKFLEAEIKRVFRSAPKLGKQTEVSYFSVPITLKIQ